MAKKKAQSVPPGCSTGLIPRDYSKHPSGYQSCAPTAPEDWLVPEEQWEERLKEQKAAKSSLWDLREANYDVLKSLDQDGIGICWAFSTTKAIMYLRAAMNEPGVILSAWYVAGVVKNWRDEGGWGAESLDEIAKGGVPPMSMCPSYKSSYNTPEVRAAAAQHKAVEWYDGSESRDHNRAIMVSAFLLGLPPVLDINGLGHSMCGCRLVSISPLVVDADNSWGAIDQYGPKGIYTLKGRNAIPDGIVVPRVTTPSLT